MEKQEILEKSRRENRKGDERVYRLARRRNTSDIVTLLISLAFLIWNLVKFFQMA